MTYSIELRHYVRYADFQKGIQIIKQLKNYNIPRLAGASCPPPSSAVQPESTQVASAEMLLESSLIANHVDKS